MTDNIKQFPIRPKKPGGKTLKILEPWDSKGCKHEPDGNTYLVDQALSIVECGKCKAKLDPMWVMLQLANKESHWYYNWERYSKERRKYEDRSRTTCEHCGKMTKIRRS
jgi:hypothetical protein